MKRLVSLFLSLSLLFSTVIISNAEEYSPGKEDYLTYYNNYYSLYENEYKTAYTSYNASLDALAQKVKEANITSIGQINMIKSFLTEISTQRYNFFGDRTTPGKSRYVVPDLRNKMFAAADNKDYKTAIKYCNDLTAAINARITFLNGLKDRVDGFKIPEPTSSMGSVSMNITKVKNESSHEFNIKITNNTDFPISKWVLKFDYDGKITNVYLDGARIKFKAKGNTYTIEPKNKHSSIYTIPAKTTITLYGEGENVGSKITNASIFDESITMTLNK